MFPKDYFAMSLRQYIIIALKSLVFSYSFPLSFFVRKISANINDFPLYIFETNFNHWFVFSTHIPSRSLQTLLSASAPEIGYSLKIL